MHVLNRSSDGEKTDSLDSGFGNEDAGSKATAKPPPPSPPLPSPSPHLSGLASSLLQHDLAQDQHLEDKFGELEEMPLLSVEPVEKESQGSECGCDET